MMDANFRDGAIVIKRELTTAPELNSRPDSVPARLSHARKVTFVVIIVAVMK